MDRNDDKVSKVSFLAMFSVKAEQRQYLTYILSDSQAGTTVDVVPERGGIITSWQLPQEGNPIEIFYMDKERYGHPELSVRGGNPILFPICGNLPDNSYVHDGQLYQLKQHGFARDLPWEVVSQSVDSAASLSIRLASNEATKEVYPFDFEVIFTYILEANRLTIQQKFVNLSDMPMPFSVGFHPYFAASDKSKLEMKIPGSKYSDKAGTEYQFDGSFDYDQEEIDIAFEQLHTRSSIVTDQGQRLQITMDWDECFSTLVFWTLKGKDFYCLEPWSAPRNAINTGNKLLVIPPQQIFETSMSMLAESISTAG
jgi:galactose mutarotase-like enzyme